MGRLVLKSLEKENILLKTQAKGIKAHVNLGLSIRRIISKVFC